MNKPRPLQYGDKVGFISPAGPIKEERLEGAISFFNSLGLKVVIGEHALDKCGYLAGTDEHRAEDFNLMFKDKSIKGIFCLRGGYGSSRILDKLDFNLIKKNPKLFCGYSDITILHFVLNKMCNLATFHSPMPCTEFYKEIDTHTTDSFKKNIFNSTNNLILSNPANISMNVIKSGVGKGRLVGGNLSVILSSLGTKYEIDFNNKILFLEEIDEPPYKIDRMILQLTQSGKLNKCNGIILGYFSGCNPSDSNTSLSLHDIFKTYLCSYNIPVVSDFACGHELPSNTIPLGLLTHVDTANNKIIVLE